MYNNIYIYIFVYIRSGPVLLLLFFSGSAAQDRSSHWSAMKAAKNTKSGTCLNRLTVDDQRHVGNLKSFIGILSQPFDGNTFTYIYRRWNPVNSSKPVMAPHSLGACGPLISIIRHCTTSTIQHFHALSAFPRLSRLQIKHTFKALQLENPIFLIKSRLENQVIDAVSFLQRDRITTSAQHCLNSLWETVPKLR